MENNFIHLILKYFEFTTWWCSTKISPNLL